MTAVAQPVTGTTHSVEFRTGEPLLRALSNALLCASDEAHIPAIFGAQVLADGSTLSVRATDRYLLLLEDLEIEAQETPWRFVLPRPALQSAVSFLKSLKRKPVTLEWEPATADLGGRFDQWPSGVVRLRGYDGSVAFTAVDAQPPTLDKLVPEVETRTAVDEIAFDVKRLAVLTKIQAESRIEYIKLGLYGAGKATRVDWSGERRTVLVMPVRISSGDWGVDGQ